MGRFRRPKRFAGIGLAKTLSLTTPPYESSPPDLYPLRSEDVPFFRVSIVSFSTQGRLTVHRMPSGLTTTFLDRQDSWNVTWSHIAKPNGPYSGRNECSR